MAHNADQGLLSFEGATPPTGWPASNVIALGSGDKYGDPKWRRAGNAQVAHGYDAEGQERLTATAVIGDETDEGIAIGQQGQAAAALAQSPFIQQRTAPRAEITEGVVAVKEATQHVENGRPPRLRFQPGPTEGTGKLVPAERPMAPAAPSNGTVPAPSAPSYSPQPPSAAEPPRRAQAAPQLKWLDSNGYPGAPMQEVLFKAGKSITRTYYHHVLVGERSITLVYDQLTKATMHMPAPPEEGEFDEMLLGVDGQTYRVFYTGMFHDDGRLILLIFLRPPADKPEAEPDEEGPSFTDSHSPTVQT